MNWKKEFLNNLKEISSKILDMVIDFALALLGIIVFFIILVLIIAIPASILWFIATPLISIFIKIMLIILSFTLFVFLYTVIKGICDNKIRWFKRKK